VELLQTHPPDRRTQLLKTTRESMNIIDAFRQLGSYRAAARLCGTSDDGFFALTSDDQVVAAVQEQVDGTRGRLPPQRDPRLRGHRLELHVRSLPGDLLAPRERRR
jgi:hypothetical protein